MPLAALYQLLRELVRQLTRANRTHRSIDVILDANELHVHRILRDIEDHVARTPVAILRPSDAPRVDEVDSLDGAMPRQMRVPEAQHVARLRAGDLRHAREERART